MAKVLAYFGARKSAKLQICDFLSSLDTETVAQLMPVVVGKEQHNELLDINDGERKSANAGDRSILTGQIDKMDAAFTHQWGLLNEFVFLNFVSDGFSC